MGYIKPDTLNLEGMLQPRDATNLEMRNKLDAMMFQAIQIWQDHGQKAIILRGKTYVIQEEDSK